jgi:hypothetical protein
MFWRKKPKQVDLNSMSNYVDQAPIANRPGMINCSASVGNGVFRRAG